MTSLDKTERHDHMLDVIDHPAVARWMKETAQRDPEGFLLLVGPNAEEFTRLFGPAEWTHSGEKAQSKGWTHGWKLHENNLQWQVLTGPNGTFFRLRTPTSSDAYLHDPKVGVGIVSYLSALLRTLAN